MSNFTKYAISLCISNTSKTIKELTHRLREHNLDLIEDLNNKKINESEFVELVLSNAYFLKAVFKTENYIERLKDFSYLKRQLKKLADELKLSNHSRRLNRRIKSLNKANRQNKIDDKKLKELINKARYNSKYCDIGMLSERKQQLESNDRFLKSQAVQSSNEIFELGGIDEQIKKRFAEYYMQIKAMELKAEKESKRWMFLTLTCPPEMHASPVMGKNTYDGTTVREAVTFINKKFNTLMKNLSRDGIKVSEGEIFGFKIIEPHRDGCPHLHALIFVDNHNVRKVLEETVKTFDYRDQFTKNRSRVKNYDNKIDKLYKRLNSKFAKCKTPSVTVTLNIEEDAKFKNKTKKKASAATYVSKYLMKNVNSTSVNSSEILKKEEVDRVDAWRSCAKARAFASIGFRGVITRFKQIKKINDCEILKLKDKKLMLALCAKGAVIIKRKSKDHHLAFEENLLAQDENNILVRKHGSVHEDYLKFAEMILSKDVEVRKVEKTYKNKYSEDAKKVVAVEIDDEKCKFKKFVMVDNKSKIDMLKLNYSTGFGYGAKLIVHYPSASAAHSHGSESENNICKSNKEDEVTYFLE